MGAIATRAGFVREYQQIPLAEHGSLLRVGKNVLAVSCKQLGGGQFVDAHIVDGEAIPTLPKPKRSDAPFRSLLVTKWGEELNASDAWAEYPRPNRQRSEWSNLNGHWDYAITPVDQAEAPTSWEGQILVPFCLESKLGDVSRLLHLDEALWYRTTFECEPNGDRLLLNFEAVDYRCEVFVNGHSVGNHVGGNTPFQFDIIDAIASGINELIVCVQDETEAFQLRGKQTLNPRGIWYTQVSGIWQTVWLESVAPTCISDLRVTSNAAEDVSPYLFTVT